MLVLLLAACGGSASSVDGAGQRDGAPPSPSSSNTSSSTPGSPTSAAPAADQPTVDAAAPGFPPTRSAVVVHVRRFASPTGNIGCQIGRTGAACVITEHDYRAGLRPSGCAGRWLPRLEVDLAHRARLGSCEGGVLDSGRSLRYGTTTVVGRISCLSRQSGMTCWSGRSGHGFTVARAAYRLH